MNEKVKTALNLYVENISKMDGVLQIYLFGSCACGNTNEKSDIDLMVVVEDKYHPIKKAVSVSRGLRELRTVPLDLLVNRKSDFDDSQHDPTLQRDIKKRGVLLYAK